MSYGQLAESVSRAAETPVFRTRDLEQITADMIAWQEHGYSADPMSLPPLYSAVSLIASTIDQLDLVADFTPDTWLQQPRRYGSVFDLGDLKQWMVTCMALRGSADIACTRIGDSWRLDAIHPGSVQAQVTTHGIVDIAWTLGGNPIREVPAFMDEWASGSRYLLHIPYVVTPGRPTGSSPVVDCLESVRGYKAVERQSANLIDNGTYSGGRLETDQDITAATAERYQTKWVENRKTGKIPVLGAGLRYVNDLVDPADAQWLESRQFNAQAVCQWFGIPTDYLGMAMSGGNSSLSYSNSQDNDRRFRRNCLERFTSQIEDALSQLAPQGRGWDEARTIRFDYTSWEASGNADDADARTVDQGI